MSLHTYLNQTWNTQQHQRVMTHVQRENTANLQAGELPATFHFLQWAFVQQAICQVGSCLVSSCSTFSHAAEKHGLRSWSIPHGLRSWSIPVLWSQMRGLLSAAETQQHTLHTETAGLIPLPALLQLVGSGLPSTHIHMCIPHALELKRMYTKLVSWGSHEVHTHVYPVCTRTKKDVH